MFDRFSIARKAYNIVFNAQVVLKNFGEIGLIADFDCPISSIEDIALELLYQHFPMVDESFFTHFFFETTEMGSEDEFIERLKEEMQNEEDANPSGNQENSGFDGIVFTLKRLF